MFTIGNQWIERQQNAAENGRIAVLHRFTALFRNHGPILPILSASLPEISAVMFSVGYHLGLLTACKHPTIWRFAAICCKRSLRAALRRAGRLNLA
jgi:hypothetical protein